MIFKVYLIIKTIKFTEQNKVEIYLDNNNFPSKELDYGAEDNGQSIAASLLYDLFRLRAKDGEIGYVPIKFETMNDDYKEIIDGQRIISFFYSCTIPWFIRPIKKMQSFDIMKFDYSEIKYGNIVQQIVSVV